MDNLGDTILETQNWKLAKVEDLPIGQKLLKLGIRPVTERDLRDHFACDKIQAAKQKELNEERKQEMEGFRKEYGNDPMMLIHLPTFVSYKSAVCSLKYCKLENYMKEEIPEYCLSQIDMARELGLEHFEVVWPEMETVTIPDPVIIAKVGDNMIWVTFFE